MLLAAVRNAAADMAGSDKDAPWELSVDVEACVLAIVRSAARMAAWASTNSDVLREEKRPRDGVLVEICSAASPQEGLAVEAGEGAGTSKRDEFGDAKLRESAPPVGVITPPERKELRATTEDETVVAETTDEVLLRSPVEGVVLVVEAGVAESTSETGTVAEVRVLSCC
jgi:hypothetical protein